MYTKDLDQQQKEEFDEMLNPPDYNSDEERAKRMQIVRQWQSRGGQ